jgi:hypothetical protein
VRAEPLCLPAAWISGEAGAFCDSDTDCHAGLFCDTNTAPNPIVDGSCSTQEAHQ